MGSSIPPTVETEVFVTSLHEIEAEIKDQRDENLRQEWDGDKQEIFEVFPKEYHEIRDVFLKKASDRLPPSRECDHRIELEGGKARLRFQQFINGERVTILLGYCIQPHPWLIT